MIANRFRPRHARPRQSGAKSRRGVALVFVLMFVIAMAALAMSSIFMASNSTLLAKSYDKERDLKFAAEAALAIGKSKVNSDPSAVVLPVDSIYRVLLFNKVLTGADNKPLSGGVFVNVYIGPTGSTSGQSGRFSSIVAEARDSRGNGFIRRLELAQESFAKFAYWSNDESNGSGTIFFNNGDELWGPVWSNDTINIGSGGATFHDVVATSGLVLGASNGTFSKGYLEKQKKISLPANSVLTLLKGYAGSGSMDFTAANHQAASNSADEVEDRIEFFAYDMGGEKPDSSDDEEGFFRRYSANNDTELRSDWPGYGTVGNVKQCGDWHYTSNPNSAYTAIDTGVKFFPASVHTATWFKTTMAAGLVRKYGTAPATAATTASNHSDDNVQQIMTTATVGIPARCYLAGDTHLVAVERNKAILPPSGVAYVDADLQKGGDDTTFTPKGNMGEWLKFSDSPDTLVVRKRTAAGMPLEAKYLFPIGRKFNNGAKGVIYESGNVGISGTVNGLVTLYAKGSVIMLDDLRYANDPATARCHDILGIISDLDVIVADNALLQPPEIANNVYKNVDDTKDFYMHAVVMALKTSFEVQNHDKGPTNVNDCDVNNNGRGCIYLSGGLIQAARGPVGTSGGTGFSKRYTYDRCAVVNPPPYFPTTGRFTENRFIELDPQGFKPYEYFLSLDPNKTP